MGDLVVGEEGRVAHGPPGVDVRDHRGHLQVALDDRAPGAHERVLPVAVDARQHVAAALLRRVAELLGDVGDHEHDRAGDAVRVGEVAEVVLAELPRALAVEHRAHGQQGVDGVAGDDVRPARAVLVQQPAPVRVPALELGGVLRVVRDDRAAVLLLPPAERGHVVVVAVQEARLAGARLRGPVRLPAVQQVAPAVRPARQVRRVAVADRAAQHVVREPVDLEEVDARHVGLDPARLARPAAHDLPVPEVLVVEREQRGEQRVDHREAERHGNAVPEAVDLDARVERRRAHHDRAVQDERPEPQREHRERQRDAHDQRPDERVREPDRRREAERGGDIRDVEAGDDRAQQHQAAGREQPDDDDPRGQVAGSHRPRNAIRPRRGAQGRARVPPWARPRSGACGRSRPPRPRVSEARTRRACRPAWPRAPRRRRHPPGRAFP